MSDHWTDRLSEYLDGDLPAAERQALEAHLRQCAECRATLADLEEVVARAQALPARPPSRDLWPAVARGIGLAPARRTRRVIFSVPQLIAASVALAVLSAGVMWLALSRSGSPRPDFAEEPTITQRVDGTPAGLLARRYEPAIAELEATLRAGRGRLDTATVRVLEESLERIDQAIAEARRALDADPASPYLNSHLERTMRRKLELLRQAAMLTRADT